jgi:CheY-like chemotaxis protein
VAKRILVAESDGIVALDLRMMLEDLGFETPTVVTTGVEALQAAMENAPLLIITETKLHGDFDGIETVARINRKVGVPVIYLTAQSDRKTLERAKETNPFGYILKPFSATQLQIMLELALQRHEEGFMAKNEHESQRFPGNPGPVLNHNSVVDQG